ncbi:tRNA lysidine(34) synthetase TilS [Algoriphagus namhaensis]
MIDAFIRHIREKDLLQPAKTYLLACSGGLDSMTLGALALQAGMNLEVAHVNFNLRGRESEEDEELVRSWCYKQGLKLHLHQADTMAFAQDSKLSIQEAAREIRYTFFDQVLRAHKLEAVLVAHHQDDQIETVFLNLLRGTGIEGMSGMSERRGKIIRPLLVFGRQELEAFAREEKLTWREDSSNQKTDYLRNKLRLDVLPHLYESKPDAKQNLLTSLDRIKDTNRAFAGLYQNWARQYSSESNGIFGLSIPALHQNSGSASLLFYWLRQFGFNSDQSKSIHQAALAGNSGKIFDSGSFLANVDRDQILVCKKEEDFSPVKIYESDIEARIEPNTYAVLQIEPGDFLDKNPEHAMLDMSKLDFPLEVRTWQQGDRFVPLGMNQEKKISDFLIDLKMPFIKKAQVKVLISDGKIAWVVGHRIADWAKTSISTRKIFYLKKT